MMMMIAICLYFLVGIVVAAAFIRSEPDATWGNLVVSLLFGAPILVISAWHIIRNKPIRRRKP